MPLAGIAGAAVAPAAGGALSSLFSGLGGIGGLSNILGGFLGNNALGQAQDDIRSSIEFNPGGAGGAFGNINAGTGQINEGAFENQFRQLLQSQLPGLLGGGFASNNNFQTAFNQNDLAGALSGANQQLGQQAQGTAFGGLGGLFNQNQQLSNLFANSVAGGPQDFSGGLQGNLFGRGQQAFNQAGNQSGLIQQNLDASRALGQDNEDRLRNQFNNQEFGRNRGATSGFQDRQDQLQGAFRTQDAQRVLGAQQLGLQQQNQLQNFGLGLSGQGAGLLGQNLGQFNQAGQFANLFGQAAQGIEGQQFGQNLGALQQNQSAGQNRLQNAMGIFGLGDQLQSSAFGQGIQGQQALLGQNQFFGNLLNSLQNTEVGRIDAVGQSNRAIADLASSQSGLLSGLFSDIRLKTNIKKIGKLGELNWYEWDWTDDAHEMGIALQPTFGVMAQEVAEVMPDAVTMHKSGYLQVNYGVLYNG